MRVGTKIKDKHGPDWRLIQQGQDRGEVVHATPAYAGGVYVIDHEDGEAVILTWDTVKALNKQRKRVRRQERCQSVGNVPAGCI